MFTHMIKKSNQRCYAAVWWPSADEHAGSKEKAYPLMTFESGQINRVKASNLKRIRIQS